MLASNDRSNHWLAESLDRTACHLVFKYGGDAAIVAYTKAVACEVDDRISDAQRWRSVLGRVVAIDQALNAASTEFGIAFAPASATRH